jgi:hypothetical protein
VRYICLAAILVALPLTASAQQHQPRQSGSENRRSDDTRSDSRREARTEGRNDPRAEDRRPPANTSAQPWWEHQLKPAWEQKQKPAWEQPQKPAWEQPRTPAWEVKQTPAWEKTGSRPMFDQQRGQSTIVNQRRARQYSPTVVYVVPRYGYFSNSIPTTTQFMATPPPPTQPVSFDPPPPPAVPMGALRIEVEPKESLQIYVDGVYLGTPADLGDELELTPGTRRIELRAREHHSLVFNAEIVDGRSITYRGSLEPAPQAPQVPKAPQAPEAVAPAVIAARATMYMIPGCYLGNVSPKSVALPAGCDISKLKTISP